LQDAQFAPPVGDRNGQRVDDAEHRYENGNTDLHVTEREPLIGDAHDEVAEFAVGEDEQSRVRSRLSSGWCGEPLHPMRLVSGTRETC
jgi:hypothetical protein